LQEYDDEAIGSLLGETSEIEGVADIEEFEDILDDLLDRQQLVGRHLEPRLNDLDAVRAFLRETISVEHLKRYQQEEDQKDTVSDFLEKELLSRRSQSDFWDCESIRSTYTNTENHPKLIRESSVKPIHLDAITGLPKISLPRQIKRQQQMLSRIEPTHGSGPDLGSARSKNENPDDKRARKQLIKQARKVRLYL
jgi:protein LTV1